MRGSVEEQTDGVRSSCVCTSKLQILILLFTLPLFLVETTPPGTGGQSAEATSMLCARSKRPPASRAVVQRLPLSRRWGSSKHAGEESKRKAVNVMGRGGDGGRGVQPVFVYITGWCESSVVLR